MIYDKHEGELGEFETVMQTRDAVEGLHNCREFSKSSIAFIKYFSKIIRQMKVTNEGKFLIETVFLGRFPFTKKFRKFRWKFSSGKRVPFNSGPFAAQ